MFPSILSRGLLKNQCNAPHILQSLRYFSSKLNIDDLVKKDKVVVFMKGSPKTPQCGFSATVVQLFRMYKVEYKAYDVLSNEEMREEIKKYTSWPTIPQVFFNGEFIGGCDILLQMHHNKKLPEELEKAGIEYAKFEEPKERKN